VIRDQLANDRTFLAWFRTGIALFGLGVIIAKVALVVNPNNTKGEDQTFFSVVGIVSVVCGGLLVIVGYVQHRRVRHHLTSDGEAQSLAGPWQAPLAPSVGRCFYLFCWVSPPRTPLK
jgi:uncharacterized membrane protein YidH (DUF202 family)